MLDKIDNFRGEYEFLSNSYSCNIELDGEIYSSVEHAFQAAKTSDPTQRFNIRNTLGSADAKTLGRQVTIDADWENKKLDIMADLIKQKFSNNLDLKIKLLHTGNRELIQSGMWKDQFWGVNKRGIGDNNLGKIIMKIRDAIQAQEGGVDAVFCKYISARGLDFVAKNLLTLTAAAKELLEIQNQNGQSSDEMRTLEDALKFWE